MAFNRSYTCRQYLAKKFICTNPTRRLLKQKDSKSATKIKDYTKTHELLDSGSKIIYADICAAVVIIECPFSQFARGLGNLMQHGMLTSRS